METLSPEEIQNLLAMTETIKLAIFVSLLSVFMSFTSFSFAIFAIKNIAKTNKINASLLKKIKEDEKEKNDVIEETEILVGLTTKLENELKKVNNNIKKKPINNIGVN